LYYTYTDYLGSLIALTNESGTVVERYAYDPWGARRNPTNWTQTDNRTTWIVNRGYTMHEHLDAFSIINMNGRVYDPLTAQFFSPDPFVQAPGNWLNFNRYSYCLNNPFRYTDPTGYVFGIDDAVIIALTIVGAYLGGVSTNKGELNPLHWDYKNPGTYFGIAVGAFFGYVGGYWLFNPDALSVSFGISLNSQWGSAAIGVSGISTTGGMSNWNFHWSTSAGGGGTIPIGERKPIEIPIPEKPKGDSRFFQGNYYEASQLLSHVSRQDGVERMMYETDRGYYFEEPNGYLFNDLSNVVGMNTKNTFWGIREDGGAIYYVQSTINGTYPFSIEQHNQYLYLVLGMGERFNIYGVYHTHPGNTMLSLDDAFQNMNGICVKAIGWDGYSRGSYFDNNTYYIPEILVKP